MALTGVWRTGGLGQAPPRCAPHPGPGSLCLCPLGAATLWEGAEGAVKLQGPTAHQVTFGNHNQAVLGIWIHRSISVSPQGRLTGLGGEDLPTIVIVAHYDAFGVAPVSTWCAGPGRDGDASQAQQGSGCRLLQTPPCGVMQGGTRNAQPLQSYRRKHQGLLSRSSGCPGTKRNPPASAS